MTDDVDLDAGVVTVKRGKNGRGRLVPIAASAVDRLRIYPTAVGTCPSLKKKRVTPHVLRHSAAMQLLQNGVDSTVIALWLGHESVETAFAFALA